MLKRLSTTPKKEKWKPSEAIKIVTQQPKHIESP